MEKLECLHFIRYNKKIKGKKRNVNLSQLVYNLFIFFLKNDVNNNIFNYTIYYLTNQCWYITFWAVANWPLDLVRLHFRASWGGPWRGYTYVTRMMGKLLIREPPFSHDCHAPLFSDSHSLHYLRSWVWAWGLFLRPTPGLFSYYKCFFMFAV